MELRTPRTLRVVGSVVLGLGALPFLYLAVAFPISSLVSDGYVDDPLYMNAIYGALCLTTGILLAWGAWRLVRPGLRGGTE